MPRKRAHGEGTIRRRSDGRWEARLTVSVSVDGKARQRSLYGRTQTEVKEKLREALELGMITMNPASRVKLSAPRVERSYSPTGEAGGKCALKAPKTARSSRRLYLPHDAMQMLEHHRRRVLELFSGTLPPMVVTAASGAPANPSNVCRAFRDLCKTAGVRPIRLHDLRHTYASLALQRGVPVKLVSERLGHAAPGFTLSVYRHLYDAERKQAALGLDELLGNVPRAVN